MARTTVDSLAGSYHELLVTLLTHGPAGRQGTAAAAGIQEVIPLAAALGPDADWLAAASHGTLAGLALVRGQADLAIQHLDIAVTAGFNDCVALHTAHVRPLHHDPRFQALYRRMRVTQADLDEFHWLHHEIQTMARAAQDMAVDNIGRLDSGVSSLSKAPLPTHEPHTAGVLATRIELAATQTALQQAVMKAEFQRSAGNTSLHLIDGDWDHPRARYDAWHADDHDTRSWLAAQARAYVPRPGADTALVPCPPLGSIRYPA